MGDGSLASHRTKGGSSLDQMRLGQREESTGLRVFAFLHSNLGYQMLSS